MSVHRPQLRAQQAGGSLTNVLNTVADQKMVLTDQALIMSIAYGLLIIALLVPIKGKSYNFTERFMAVLSLLVPFFISVYIINCMTTCSTETYCKGVGWGFVVFTFLWCIFLLISVLYVAIMGVPANEVVISNNNNVEGMSNNANTNANTNANINANTNANANAHANANANANAHANAHANANANANTHSNTHSHTNTQNENVMMPEEVSGMNSNTHYSSLNEAMNSMPAGASPVGMEVEGFSVNAPF